MKLVDVLAGVKLETGLPQQLAAQAVHALEYDSRRVDPGSLFFAFPGAHVDGRQFSNDAVDRGALAVVSELPAPEGFPHPWIKVAHGRQALAMACRNLFGPPERDLFLHGFTGTNGKTTSTLISDAVLRTAGFQTAVLGTIGNWLVGEFQSTANTTPE